MVAIYRSNVYHVFFVPCYLSELLVESSQNLSVLLSSHQLSHEFLVETNVAHSNDNILPMEIDAEISAHSELVLKPKKTMTTFEEISRIFKEMEPN
mmetsp:Transcript_5000/g.3638  ORF Transcript_5000/g.3638 Transcript_5000/m.3638 type:complete len:96 (-) Transcript_5000:1381-1668(-)